MSYTLDLKKRKISVGGCVAVSPRLVLTFGLPGNYGPKQFSLESQLAAVLLCTGPETIGECLVFSRDLCGRLLLHCNLSETLLCRQVCFHFKMSRVI